MKLIAQATCYMPVTRGDQEIQQRFEDGDLVEGTKARVKPYLASGNFLPVPDETPGETILIDDKDSPIPEAEPEAEEGEPEAEEGTEESENAE